MNYAKLTISPALRNYVNFYAQKFLVRIFFSLPSLIYQAIGLRNGHHNGCTLKYTCQVITGLGAMLSALKTDSKEWNGKNSHNCSPTSSFICLPIF